MARWIAALLGVGKMLFTGFNRLSHHRANDAVHREAFDILADGLESFTRSLPSSCLYSFNRTATSVYLQVVAPTRRHRRLVVDGSRHGFEYELGAVWTENLEAMPQTAIRLLAACDAVLAGNVKEARDLKSGGLHHVYRLRTRGLHSYLKDSQYSLWSPVAAKIRRVQIASIPPLAAE